MSESGSDRASGRRSPTPGSRKRDAERSRQLLLDAGLEEFAAKGFAGARVDDIARRAGVNKQLITYYFGGKEGLYRALSDVWLEQESDFAHPDMPLDELITEYLRAGLSDPRMARLVVWAGLEEDRDEVEPAPPSEIGVDIEDLIRRQKEGQLAPNLDPAWSMLAMMGMVLTPVMIPQIVRRITGLDPRSPEFQERYAEELRKIIRHLAG